jgi:two-component system, LytTR family, sensor kinase
MHNAAFFIKYKIHHLLFWLLVFGLWLFFRVQDYSSGNLAFKVTLVKVADLALMVYITNYLLIPYLFYRKRYVVFTIVFIVMVITSSFLKMNILGNLTNNPALLNFTHNLKGRIYDNVIPHFFLVIAGAAFKLMLDYARMQKQMVEVIKERSQAELNFLKSQINPHFLFNSLNSVYFLIDKDNKEARDTLHKFSEMLRYQLYEADGEAIPIEKEIRYIQDYMDLQRIRKDENYRVVFNCSGEVKNISIQPLLLIPFLENAFKHISHNKKEINYIEANLEFKDQTLHFTVVNSKNGLEKTTEQPGGIGLKNAERRLQLLYPGKHRLDVRNEFDRYSVDLTITV